MKLSETRAARTVKINGIVQGVGFRPFVYNLACSCNIKGWVNNFSGGVYIVAEGTADDIESFLKRLRAEAPPLSIIDSFSAESSDLKGYTCFEIRKSSTERSPQAYISPDIAVCSDCLREMNDPKNRRYRYPFINCTNCGPRFTITKGIPYDRINTTMSTFPMCGECENEYLEPSDRRFHAQPVACDKCGPELMLLDADGELIAQGRETETAIELLKSGKIIAIKGLGGYHLACDAENTDAIRQLRSRKRRDGKPFALMGKNMDVIRDYCFVSEKEAKLLQSVMRPIVLLDRKPAIGPQSDLISPDNDKIGIMLPYTPLHHLLFESELKLLVMTSGNISNEPIFFKDDEAIRGLRKIADYYLTNNRDIFIRTDDSVLSVFRNKECLIRRSRGYVPLPIDISAVFNGFEKNKIRVPSILACGGELKNTFCITKGDKAFLSHHIGDLENIETMLSFEQGIEHFKNIFSISPEIAAFDMHPDYLSTKYAEELTGIIKFPIQHHKAHIASCMVENGITGKVIGLAFDGTGYGDDGKIWGGEFFVGDYSRFERRAHFEYVPLPGGDAAIKEPWRMALSYLYEIYGEAAIPFDLPFFKSVETEKLNIVLQQISKRINSPLTSSVGRLFDAVSAICGLSTVIEYEGQAAIRLEKHAKARNAGSYPYETVEKNEKYQISIRKMLEAIVYDVLSGRDISEISAAFHKTLSQISVDICKKLRSEYGINQVALSGGVFQNRLLLGLTIDGLEAQGFSVYTHSKVPTNDGGLSLGQTAIALRNYLEGDANTHG